LRGFTNGIAILVIAALVLVIVYHKLGGQVLACPHPVIVAGQHVSCDGTVTLPAGTQVRFASPTPAAAAR
jgi:hypothetical protein